MDILKEHIYGKRPLEGAALPRSPLYGSVGMLDAPPDRNRVPRSASHLDIPPWSVLQARVLAPQPVPAAQPVPAPEPVPAPQAVPAPATPPVPVARRRQRHNKPYTFLEMHTMLNLTKISNKGCKLKKQPSLWKEWE